MLSTVLQFHEKNMHDNFVRLVIYKSNYNYSICSSVFRHHTTHAITWGPAVQGGPCGTRFLPMGIENRHFFGPVGNWVNTGLPISLRTNNTVIDTSVVLSQYFCVNGELEAVLINRSQDVFRQRFGRTCSGTVSDSVRHVPNNDNAEGEVQFIFLY